MADVERDRSELVRLVKLVKAMRSVQKKYHSGDRSTATLTTAKDLERRVDKAVDWVLDHRQPRQPMLFADPPAEAGRGPYGGECDADRFAEAPECVHPDAIAATSETEPLLPVVWMRLGLGRLEASPTPITNESSCVLSMRQEAMD